jgi:hypothetical protein
MANGSYPSAIKGFRFLKQRELAPVSTAWDYQLTEDFSVESASKLFFYPARRLFNHFL